MSYGILEALSKSNQHMSLLDNQTTQGNKPPALPTAEPNPEVPSVLGTGESLLVESAEATLIPPPLPVLFIASPTAAALSDVLPGTGLGAAEPVPFG